MCGGLTEMQSRRPPLLHTKDIAADGALLITSSAGAHKHVLQLPAPAGLAIVAALQAELLQSPATKASESAVPSRSTTSPPIPISSAAPWPAPEETSDEDHSSIFSTSLSPPCSYYRELYHDFLGVCFSCNRPLGPGKDIYIYRGDRAFCSIECRHKHIVVEESLLCSIQINQQCVQASSPTSQPKFTPPVAILV